MTRPTRAPRPPRLLHCVALLAAATPLATQAPATADLPDDRATGAATITVDAARARLTKLTSPEFGGRETGHPGYTAATRFVRDHFAELGLQPGAGDDSYRQRVPWELQELDGERCALVVRHGDAVALRLGAADFRGVRGADVATEGRLALLATHTPDAADLGEHDLTDRAVIVFARAGLAPEGRGMRAGYRNLFRVRAAIRERGGQLVAVVDDRLAEALGPMTGSSRPAERAGGRAGRAARRRPTVLCLDADQGDELLGALDLELAALPPGAPHEPDDATAAFTLAMQTREVRVDNVIAILPGADPELRDEYVAIGCHLDHLGYARGVLHPGADDDGSGTTGLMAVAEAFAANPVRPRRSILFLAFCGEEKGLVGSRYFAAQPTVPLESIVAELQMDMIGRNESSEDERAEDNLDSLHLVGTQKLSADLHELSVALNEQRAGFELEWDEEGVFYRSDHWNFAREGIPVAFFFTGFHPDYHQPTDTVDKIDFPKLTRIATYVYDLAFELAQRDERPLVDAERWEALRNKGRAEPVAPLRD